jgi:diguanylate cyclase (GGDEF)-like protein
VSHIDRLRRVLAGEDPVAIQGGVWAFAAVLTVPAEWACALVVLLWAQAAWHRHRDGEGLYQVWLHAAGGVLAVAASSAVVRVRPPDILDRPDVPDMLIVAAAAATYALIMAVVVKPGFWLVRRSEPTARPLFAANGFGYELVGVLLALVTAEFLVDAPVLTPLVIVLAAAVHRGALVKELHAAAATDAKTGLLNAAAWSDYARGMLRRAAIEARPVALMVLDLDHFKRINDLYGHLVGDEVLSAVATCLRRELRGQDGIGRFGGEEFVVVLDGLDPSAARSVADRVRDAVAAIRLRGDLGLQVTTSIGLAHTARPATITLERLLGRADEALYDAKSAGRDQVRTAPAR